MDTPKAISVIPYGELVYGCRKSQRPTTNLAKVHRLAEIYPVIDGTRSVMDSFGVIKANHAFFNPDLDYPPLSGHTFP